MISELLIRADSQLQLHAAAVNSVERRDRFFS
jgi:hypothetical protein